jgi:hypothetical protein
MCEFYVFYDCIISQNHPKHMGWLNGGAYSEIGFVKIWTPKGP